MISLIITAGVGVLISVLGIINMTGNISSLHWYHRQRVSEADRKPFGRIVGLGTLIMGIAIVVFGILMFIYEKTQTGICTVIGASELIVGIVLGLVLSVYAMIKYNKGIF